MICSCVRFNKRKQCSHHVIKGKLKTRCLRRARYKTGPRFLCEFHQCEFENDTLNDSLSTSSTSDEIPKVSSVVLRKSIDCEHNKDECYSAESQASSEAK